MSLPVFPNVAASFNVDPNIPSPSFSSASSAIKAAYVIDELLTTEQVYVNELNSLIEFYVKAFERPTLQSSIPPSLVGQQNVLFGNLVDLWQFHSQQFLKDLMSAKQHPRQIARCFLERRAHFYLYNIYCQNKPRSESLRSDIGECHPFFQAYNLIFAFYLKLVCCITVIYNCFEGMPTNGWTSITFGRIFIETSTTNHQIPAFTKGKMVFLNKHVSY